MHHSLQNVTLTLVTILLPPFTMMEVNNETSEISYSGLFFEAVHVLSRDLGFSFRVIQPPDGIYGVQLENGSFSGVIGMLAREEADIGVAGFSVTFERYRSVDFLKSWWEDPITCLMGKNSSFSVAKNFKPLSTLVWLLCLASVASLTVIYWTMKMPWATGKLDSAIQNCALHFYEITMSALKQSMGPLPNRSSLRLIFATWWLCALIISAAYSANLVAIMSVEVDSVPVNSLDDLSTQTHTKVAIMRGTSLHGMLQTTEIPVQHRIHANLDKLFENNETQALTDNEVSKGDLIILMELTNLKSLRAKSPQACSLALGKETFYGGQNIAFPVRKSFPYKDEFNTKILQIIESGLMNEWIKKYMPKEPYCVQTPRRAKSTALWDVFGAALFFVTGTAFSFLILMLERIISKTK